MCRKSTHDLSSSTSPRVTRETSSKSSTRLVMCLTCRSMIRLVLRIRSSSSWVLCSSSAAALIGASGLRNSCASIARNSSLRRLASFNLSSASRRIVMSLAAPIHSKILPCSSRIGTALETVQPQLPSARMTRCSSSNTVLLRIASSIVACTICASSANT